jgi:hypothetical protein
MAADRSTRITIETERILIMARQHTAYGWCERCGQQVELLPSAHASRLLHVPQDRLQGQHQGKLHLEEAKDGLVVCLKSLLRLLQSAGGQRRS